MTEKKRPPRFEDIAARSHRPPRRAAVSPFALAYEAEEARKKAGLDKATPGDLPGFDGNGKDLQVDGKVDGNPSEFDGKTATPGLTAISGLTATMALTATPGLTAKKKIPPSWQLSKITLRLQRAKIDQLHLAAMSRGITLQDLLGGWVDAFLADEGLTATPGLTASAGCRPTDQMIDDVVVTSTSSSSVLARPEDLLAYYAGWTGNQIRESDWQTIRLALSYAPAAIKAGILMSILRTKTKVNSFKYCLGAIDEVAKAGIVASADHVRYLEKKLEKAREGKAGEAQK